MRVRKIGGFNVGYSDTDELLQKRYGGVSADLNNCKWTGARRLTKAQEQRKIISSPFSMSNLLRPLASKNCFLHGYQMN